MSDEQRIYTPDEVALTRSRGEAKLGNLTSEQVRHLRHRAKHDLFFLAMGVLGYDKLSKNLHLQLCRWLQSTDTDKFRLILLPRSHYKSTITTISDSIRIALPDDLGTSPYPRNLGLNVRVLLAHETDSSAQRFLASIRDFIYRSEVLLALFPEITPNKGRTDNKGELELNREKVWSEPTFSTMGVGGKKQGAHFDYIKGDDLQGEAATVSKSEKATLIQWVDNLQSFLVTPRTDHIDFVGTRWAFDDVWMHIIKNYEKQLKVYTRSVIEYNPETKTRDPIFPEEFTQDSLNILKKNKRVWNAQYLNNPAEGANEFQSSWKRYFNWKGRNIIVFNGDSSSEYALSDLDKIIFVDPAVKGNYGYCVTGMNHRGDVFVLESYRKNWTPPEFVSFLFAQVLKWNPRVVVVEDVLFSNLYQHWLVREMQSRRHRFRIEPAKTRGKEKESRIMALSNYFEAGQIYFHSEQYDINEEFDEFGASDNIHILDALAYGPEFWKKPARNGDIDANRAAERIAVAASRDSITGYSEL